MSKESLREFIRSKYKNSGMGQRGIAAKAGISAQAFNLYLGGGNMRDDNIDALLRVFGYELHHKKAVKKK